MTEITLISTIKPVGVHGSVGASHSATRDEAQRRPRVEPDPPEHLGNNQRSCEQ